MTDLVNPGQRTAQAVLVRGYAALSYAAFVAATVWAVLFLADVRVVPVVDRAGHRAAWMALVAVELARRRRARDDGRRRRQRLLSPE